MLVLEPVINVFTDPADKSYLIVARIEKVVAFRNQTTYFHAKRNTQWKTFLEWSDFQEAYINIYT